MIRQIGNKSTEIKKYYKINKESLDQDKKRFLRTAAREAAAAEGILLLKRMAIEKIYTVEDLCDIFSLKEQFVITNFLKDRDFKGYSIGREVRDFLIKNCKTVINQEESQLHLFSSEHGDDLVGTDFVDVVLDPFLAEKCYSVLHKKIIIFESELCQFLTCNFEIVLPEGSYKLSYEGASQIIKHKWASAGEVQERTGLKHLQQVYRLLKNPAYGYDKIIYKNSKDSKRHSLARYAKWVFE